MECAVCGGSTRIYRTEGLSGFIVRRTRWCTTCDTRMVCYEQQFALLIFNPDKMRMEEIPMDRLEEYREHLLGRAAHPGFTDLSNP